MYYSNVGVVNEPKSQDFTVRFSQKNSPVISDSDKVV